MAPKPDISPVRELILTSLPCKKYIKQRSNQHVCLIILINKSNLKENTKKCKCVTITSQLYNALENWKFLLNKN